MGTSEEAAAKRRKVWIWAGFGVLLLGVVATQDKKTQPPNASPSTAAERSRTTPAQTLAAPRPKTPAELDDEARGREPACTPAKCAAVNIYLAARMHDPDSLAPVACSPPEARGSHWVVTCSYRGKNASGAVVLNEQTFWIQHDRVVRAE